MAKTECTKGIEMLKKQWGVEVGMKIGIVAKNECYDGEIKGIAYLKTYKAILITLYPIALSIISNDTLTKVILCENGTALFGEDFQKEAEIFTDISLDEV